MQIASNSSMSKLVFLRKSSVGERLFDGEHSKGNQLVTTTIYCCFIVAENDIEDEGGSKTLKITWLDQSQRFLSLNPYLNPF